MKQKLTLAIPPEVIEKARKKDINISQFLEDKLREELKFW